MDQNGQDNRIPATRPKRLSIPQLDTIRALAMLSIFFHHLWKTVITVPQGTWQKILDPVFSSASDGIILFNIISGFLLAMPHLGLDHRPFGSYPQFLRKRCARIIPAYYLALLVFTLMNMLRFDYPLDSAANMLLQHLLFVNSLNYSNMLTNFSPFWYLGQLVQFYLLFPLVLGFFKLIGPGKATLSIGVLCWGGWMLLGRFIPETPGGYPGFIENLMHFNLPGHLPEFAIGMWLASLWGPASDATRGRSIFNGPFGLFTAGMCLYLVVGTPLYSYMELPFLHVYHAAISFVVFLVLFLWGFAARLGGSPIVKNIAGHSYSLYIVHHPIFSYTNVMPSTVAHTIGNFGFLTLWLLPLCYLSAIVLDFLSDGIVKIFSVRAAVPEREPGL